MDTADIFIPAAVVWPSRLSHGTGHQGGRRYKAQRRVLQRHRSGAPRGRAMGLLVASLSGTKQPATPHSARERPGAPLLLAGPTG